jgi:non-ribosomal peptide synthetase component F
MALIGLSGEDHVLVVVVHHIVWDGYSASILFKEMMALYEAYSQDLDSPLPALSKQYVDYALWQRAVQTESALAPDLAYFVGELSGASPLLTLPYDGARPAVQTFKGAEESIHLEPAKEASLRALAHEEGATLFVTFMSALQVLLYRYSNQTDIVVGFPVSGRTEEEYAGLLGVFINTLALRCDLSGNPSFRALLGQARDKASGAIAHQALPFSQLVKALQPYRLAGVTPVFQVLLNWKVFSLNQETRCGLTVTHDDNNSGDALFDLTVEVTRTDSGLRCALIYNTDLFEAASMRRMCGHFQVLLAGIVAQPDAGIGEVPLLSAQERQQMLIEWNETQAAYPEESGFHQLFEAQVAEQPDTTALVFGEERVTYGRLNARANRLAHYLQSLNAGRETRVGIYLERSIDMVVSLLAVLKAGAAYVPLDRSHPAERLRFVLEDVCVQVVLTQDTLVVSLPATRAQIVCLEQVAERVGALPVGNPSWAGGADRLAYVIYTSGSTGQPKGVAITHGSVCNLLYAARADFEGPVA